MQVKSQTIQQEQNYVLQTYNRPDFVLVRGDGMILYDDAGNAYRDWVAGIAVNALGYNDAGVAQAMQAQAQTGILHTSNLYHTQPHAALAQALVEQSFADRVFFCNSGTEANEGAMKFARRVAYSNDHTDKTEIVTFSRGFHGRTMGSLAVTPKDKYQKPFHPLIGNVKVGTFNDLDGAKTLIGANTAAVIVEPIQGEGGIHVADDVFLQGLRDLCDAHDALLIFDEVQCGVGRTGKLWAHEHFNVTPDIMAIAKPLANGLPIGAILVTQQIADYIKPGDHGTTFGGGAFVTHVAHHVFTRISQPAFLAHVTDVGTYLQERLAEINSPLIEEIRGEGLMIGMQLRANVAEIVQAGFEHGLLLVNAGADTIRFVPPLIATRADVDHLITQLTAILGQYHD
jgi:acetylornithine/N-succinyldiaminopimelate aminotransferase